MLCYVLPCVVRGGGLVWCEGHSNTATDRRAAVRTFFSLQPRPPFNQDTGYTRHSKSVTSHKKEKHCAYYHEREQ